MHQTFIIIEGSWVWLYWNKMWCSFAKTFSRTNISLKFVYHLTKQCRLECQFSTPPIKSRAELFWLHQFSYVATIVKNMLMNIFYYTQLSIWKKSNTKSKYPSANSLLCWTCTYIRQLTQKILTKDNVTAADQMKQLLKKLSSLCHFY